MCSLKTPKVSVIIPVYNGEKYVSDAIESVLNQTYKNIEVIIVDDGSTDNTFEKIKPYLSKIKYIYQENAGLCRTRNKGILNSTGELIAFLDHDDIWLSEKTEKQVNYLLANPQYKFIHCSVKYINYQGEIIKPSGYWGKLKLNGEVKNIKEIFMHYAMLPSTMMVKRQLLDEVGLWNHTFSHCEGYDLCLRIAREYYLGYINEALVLYRLHDSNASKDVIGFDLNRINIIETFLEKYPDVHKIIHKRNITYRLFNLYLDMAKTFLWTGNYTEAKKFFWKAYKKYPADLKCLKEFLWYSLTPSQRGALSWYKEKFKTMFSPRVN